MMRTVYGVEVARSNGTYDTLVEVTGYTMARAGMPGSFTVDYLPISKSFNQIRRGILRFFGYK